MSDINMMLIVSGVLPLVGLLAGLITSQLNLRQQESKNWTDTNWSPSFTTEKPTEEPFIDPTLLIWLRPISTTIFGFALGAGTRFLRPYLDFDLHYDSILAIVLLLYLILRSVNAHGNRGSLFSFAIENAALWMSFVTGWTLIHGELWYRFTEAMIPFSIGSSIVGGLIVLLMQSRSHW